MDESGRGPGEGICQLRVSKCRLVLSLSMTSQWWLRPLSMAENSRISTALTFRSFPPARCFHMGARADFAGLLTAIESLRLIEGWSVPSAFE